MDTENPITQLSAEDTLKFLSGQSLGRLAISVNGHPDIFPVNYVIQARSHDDVVAYIRASAGNKLFATAVGSPLALETHLVETETATSAILYGTARQVQYPDNWSIPRVSPPGLLITNPKSSLSMSSVSQGGSLS